MSPTVELSQAQLDGAPNGGAGEPRVLRILPTRQGESGLEVTHHKPWDSFFVRMLVTLFAVGLPFVILGRQIRHALVGWGTGVDVVGIVLLVAVTAATTWLVMRPITALSRAAARAEAGDLTARVVPGGGGEIRLLGQTFNSMLERLAGMHFRLRGEVAESAAGLALAAEHLAAATLEQTTAATQTSSTMEELARGSVSIAETAAQVATQAGDLRAKIATAQTDIKQNGEKMVELAHRIGDIEAILALIEGIAQGSRSVAATAQEIALAASRQGALSTEVAWSETEEPSRGA